MPDPENDLFMQISTILLNNWDVRISLYEVSESFRVSTYLSPVAREGYAIETEYVNALS